MRSWDPDRRRATLLGSLALLLAGSIAFGVAGAATDRPFVTTTGAAGVLLGLIGLVVVLRPQVRWLVPALVPVVIAAVAGIAWQSQVPILHLFHVVAKGASVAATAAFVILAAGRDPQVALDRAVHVIGEALAKVLGVVAFGLVVVPAWSWSRLRRRDVLRTSHLPAWNHLAPEPTSAAPHLGSSRSAPPPLSLLGRGLWAIGCAVAILAANFGVGWTWDRVTEDSPAGAAPADISTYRDPRTDSPAMAAYPWRERYFRDIQRARTSYWPYTEYRPYDFTSRYVNQRGWRRLGYEAEGDPDTMPLVWMFGGSTTWGEGQRDRFTIASWLVRLSEQDGIPIRMSNYGQRGWVHFQEMILYEQQLDSEPDPDLAVFYDGANEITTQSLIEEAVPSHTLAYTYAKRINNASVATRVPDARPDDLFGALVDAYKEHSALHKVVGFVRGTAAGAAPLRVAGEPPVGPGFTGGQEEERGAIYKYDLTEQDGIDAGKVYERGKRFTLMLSKRHKVETLMFWQPMFVNGPPQDRAREQLTAPTVDIAEVLDDHKDVYIDGAHTNEEGARLVAVEIWQRLKPAVQDWYEANR